MDLDRFKSGFLVDNFSGHSIGDVQHPDYRVAIDMEEQELRPKYFMKGVSLLKKILLMLKELLTIIKKLEI